MIFDVCRGQGEIVTDEATFYGNYVIVMVRIEHVHFLRSQFQATCHEFQVTYFSVFG